MYSFVEGIRVSTSSFIRLIVPIRKCTMVHWQCTMVHCQCTMVHCRCTMVHEHLLLTKTLSITWLIYIKTCRKKYCLFLAFRCSNNKVHFNDDCFILWMQNSKKRACLQRLPDWLVCYEERSNSIRFSSNSKASASALLENIE